jgi:hypothetical protein
MNGTERAYALLLEARRRAGQVREYHFAAIALTLAHDCRYTPDFLVVLADDTVELHETKGSHMRDDALVKLKVCARLYPFPLRLARLVKGSWTVTEVTP